MSTSLSRTAQQGPVNAGHAEAWQRDIDASVAAWNGWYEATAPRVWDRQRAQAADKVAAAFAATSNLCDLSGPTLAACPEALPILRQCCAPPLGRDRLIGLAAVPPHLVRAIEMEGRLPVRAPLAEAEAGLAAIGRVIARLADPALFPWLADGSRPDLFALDRARLLVADRQVAALAEAILRNAQEARQLAALESWLAARGYQRREGQGYQNMPPGSYELRLGVPASQPGGGSVRLPMDAVIKPHGAGLFDLPLFIEAKSAGDFVNTNKRRKEEALRQGQLQAALGPRARLVLLLAGYFDAGYLAYEAAHGLDWVWEHRLDDLAEFGL